MTSFQRLKRLHGDERGQAMTEFVLVIPIVLLMFFLAIETLVIARATQLGNYAAFSAARSYATSFSKFERATGNANTAHDEASRRSRNAALLIMAPVAQAQVGEGVPIWSTSRNIAKSMGPTTWSIYGLAEGYAVGAIFRMKNFEVQRPANLTSSSESVRVSFDYEMPLAIPGFAEMWDFLARKEGTPLAEDTFDPGSFTGDPGMLSTLDDILDGLTQIDQTFGLSQFTGIRNGVQDAINDVYTGGYVGALYTMTVSAKSICGFEPWSGAVRTDDITPYCNAEADPSRADCVDATSTYQGLAERQAAICEEARLAKDLYDERVVEYEEDLDTYQDCLTVTNADCSAEYDAMILARDRRDDAYDLAEDKADDCEDATDDTEDAYDDMGDECD